MNKLSENDLKNIALTSPALTWQSDKKGQFAYPANFRGRVPLKVKMATTVMPDLPFCPINTVADKDVEYFVWVNSYGAVSAILSNGEKLGLRPSEFDVIEWHPECISEVKNGQAK